MKGTTWARSNGSGGTSLSFHKMEHTAHGFSLRGYEDYKKYSGVAFKIEFDEDDMQDALAVFCNIDLKRIKQLQAYIMKLEADFYEDQEIKTELVK